MECLSNDNNNNEKELETLIQVVRIYRQDIEMELGMEKCAMLIMTSAKQQAMEGIELPNQEKNQKAKLISTWEY